MVDIVNGEIVRDDLTKKAHGGTELQAELMIKHIDSDLLNQFQIIHSRVRNLDDTKKKILVLHDLAGDPEVENLSKPEYRNQFDRLVFVSDHQLQQYNMVLGVPYKNARVIHNTIEPFPQKQKKFDGPIRIIYHTTPHRGLSILVPVFEKILEANPDKEIHLDVYSSFSIYGWEQRDEPYQALFTRCKNNPNITYHGAVSNEEIRQKLEETHIFAYPSIWPETSAISVIEAMAAQNFVVIPNYAALPETASNFAVMYQWSENPQEHANRFANALNNTIRQVHWMGLQKEITESHQYLMHQQDYFNRFYGVARFKREWETLLKEILTVG